VERELYDEHASLEQDHWWFVGRRAIIDAVLTRHLPAVTDRRILDVGCGTGGMLPLLARFGTVSGIEAEPLAVEHCRSAFGEFEVRLGAIPEGVPSDGGIDLVTAFDVIEHIEDDLAALRSLREALCPAGVAVITVPALQWLWSDHDVVNGHQRRYTRRRLVDVVEQAGFHVQHVSYFNTALLPVVATARLAQGLRKRPVAPHSDFTMPSAPVNATLTWVLGSERRIVARTGLPVGVSLIAVLTR
jgi:2-polyprenyl-3-methyl-5-hydroxy-6-metoxy-1,4-benzoquinol methylase